ncbi:MAG: DUF3784 domain-containing protein [Eubacterium sp.]|nr:DUF3784 domain-containing protein [Eubacterium sp.]
MFTSTFDWFLAGIFFLLAIVFFAGKGQGILDAFSGKYREKKKLSPENQLRYQRAVGVFLIVLSAVEVFMALLENQIMGIISIVVTVVDLIAIITYVRKLYD